MSSFASWLGQQLDRLGPFGQRFGTGRAFGPYLPLSARAMLLALLPWFPLEGCLDLPMTYFGSAGMEFAGRRDTAGKRVYRIVVDWRHTGDLRVIQFGSAGWLLASVVDSRTGWLELESNCTGSAGFAGRSGRIGYWPRRMIRGGCFESSVAPARNRV